MATFVARLPAWTGDDGFPLSWRHWVYGLAWVARDHSRDLLFRAQAYRQGQAMKEDFERFSRDVETVTGVPRITLEA